MKKTIFTAIAIAIFSLAFTIPSFAVVYSGVSTTYAPHPTTPNHWCTITTSWFIEFDAAGNVVSEGSVSSNSCFQSIVINQTHNVSMQNGVVTDLRVASCTAENGGNTGGLCDQYDDRDFISALIASMNREISGR